MNEQDAIKKIRKECCNRPQFQLSPLLTRKCSDGCMYGENKCAYSIAIKALEEIQSYRAIEQRLKNIYGECDGLLEAVITGLENHDGINFPDSAGKSRLLTDDDVDKWEAYKAIGTVEEIKSFFNDNRKAGYKHGYSDGYTKAVDEFAEKCREDILCQTFGLHPKNIDEIAEQMKSSM